MAIKHLNNTIKKFLDFENTGNDDSYDKITGQFSQDFDPFLQKWLRIQIFIQKEYLFLK